MSYEYPQTDDPDYQKKIYEKREFYYQKVSPRDRPLTEEEITQYRQKICGAKLELQGHQIFLSNFINPATPYTGILIFHGTGVGKTCAAIAIAEQFREQVDRYGTKIHVVLPGPIMKEQFKYALTTECTDHRYIPDRDTYPVLNPDQQARARKIAMNTASRYYSIISYKNFHKRIIGEKLKLKGEDGKPQRELSMNRITSLDNTVLIIDEAHNFTNNEYGDALQKIIAASKNLRIVLMTATPMKNVPDDIIPMLNFLRPQNDPIQRSRVFTSGKDYQMEFIPGGKEYLQKMATGYVSYMKGNNPFLFAKKEDMGEIPDRLMFTPLIRCPMREFQLATYNTVVREKNTAINDSLDKVSEAVANFAFPVMKGKGLQGAHGEAGLELMRAQLSESSVLATTISKTLKSNSPPDEMVTPSKTHITGKILTMDYLENFSSKFHTCMNNLLKLSSGTAFVYTSLVKVGIRLFEEVLRANGFVEYSESGDYVLEPETLHYSMKSRYKDHKEGTGEFYPATYIVIVGAADDATQIPAEKLSVLQNVFNRIENSEGKNIKLVLGSKVVNEGVTMENVSEVHILDVWYHLGRVDQVVGRAIRQCKHFKMISDKNPYPSVKVFKYVVSLPGQELSREEQLYKKAEIKYINIKKVERALIEVSVDCPINYGSNQTFEDLVAYKDCVPIDEADSDTPKQIICPARCEFTKCHFQCEGKVLNTEYYDKERGIYRNIMNSKLDYSTFSQTFARVEIGFAKTAIRDMYRLNDYYNLDQMVDFVREQYPPEKKDMFDQFFVYQAIDDLIPVDEKDLYDFEEFLFNRYNVTGYLMYRDGFYVFRPVKETQVKNILRNMTFRQEVEQDLPLRVFLSYGKVQPSKDFVHYDFETSQDYYLSREENTYVGIIDHPPNLAKLLKLNQASEVQDVFKIREKRARFQKKQREIGLPTVKGAVCMTVGQKQRLDKMLRSLGIKVSGGGKQEMCDKIRDTLLFMEKFADGKAIPKKTYLIIPTNHPTLPFPLNHQDRLEEIKDSFTKPTIEKKTKTMGKIKVDTYIVTLPDTSGLDKELLKRLGFEKKMKIWECKME